MADFLPSTTTNSIRSSTLPTREPTTHGLTQGSRLRPQAQPQQLHSDGSDEELGATDGAEPKDDVLRGLVDAAPAEGHGVRVDNGSHDLQFKQRCVRNTGRVRRRTGQGKGMHRQVSRRCRFGRRPVCPAVNPEAEDELRIGVPKREAFVKNLLHTRLAEARAVETNRLVSSTWILAPRTSTPSFRDIVWTLTLILGGPVEGPTDYMDLLGNVLVRFQPRGYICLEGMAWWKTCAPCGISSVESGRESEVRRLPVSDAGPYVSGRTGIGPTPTCAVQGRMARRNVSISSYKAAIDFVKRPLSIIIV